MSKPSVTELIRLLDKPALLGWANKIGLEGVSLRDARQKSMSAGVSWHKKIENYLVGEIPIQDEEFSKKVKKFFADKTIIACEKPIAHNDFDGRFDVKYKSKNGDIYICDFKTNQKRLYRENKLQLAAYRMAEGCDKVAVISVPDMVLIESEIEDFAPYESMIRHLVAIYHLDIQISK